MTEDVIKFKKGDYIVYSSIGICEVVDITTMGMPGVEKDKQYYVLQPCNHSGNKIFTAVDNKRMVMRNIMTKEEADELIHEIPDIEMLWITDEKQREESYKACIRSCVGRDWIKVIKTLYQRRQDRIDQGKKITATDERYLKIAEENLFTELSIPFKMQKSEMGDYIISIIHISS